MFSHLVSLFHVAGNLELPPLSRLQSVLLIRQIKA